MGVMARVCRQQQNQLSHLTASGAKPQPEVPASPRTGQAARNDITSKSE